MVNPENIHVSIQIEQLFFRNIYLYTYIVTTINEKEVMNLEKSKDGYMGGFGGREGE